MDDGISAPQPFDYGAAFNHVSAGGTVLVVPALNMSASPLVLDFAEQRDKGFLSGWVDTSRGKRAAIVQGTDVYIAYDRDGSEWVPFTKMVGGMLMRLLV